MTAIARAVYRTALAAALAMTALGYVGIAAGAQPWDDDPAVQEVCSSCAVRASPR
jgi:hypothetical protein